MKLEKNFESDYEEFVGHIKNLMINLVWQYSIGILISK